MAARDRRFGTPLLAFIVVIEERSIGAHNLAAMVAVGLEAVIANQGTNPRRLQLDRVERIGGSDFDVEFGASVAVEQAQRALRGPIPLAVSLARKAANAAQLGLHRFCQVGL